MYRALVGWKVGLIGHSLSGFTSNDHTIALRNCAHFSSYGPEAIELYFMSFTGAFDDCTEVVTVFIMK